MSRETAKLPDKGSLMQYDYHTEQELEDLIHTLLATRDLCGNERAVLRDWQAENGDITPQETCTVLTAVEMEWNRCRRAAGVKLQPR